MRHQRSDVRRQLMVLTALTAVTAAFSPVVGQTSLSIYKDGRIVVRQTVPQALTKGRNTLTLRLDGLDPATLFSPDSAVTVLSARVRYASTAAAALAVRTDSGLVQVVAGQSNGARAPAAPPEAGMRMEADMVSRQAVVASGYAEEQAVGEAHVYDLPGRFALEPGVPVTTAIFPRASVAVTKDFVVPGVLPWRGWLGQTPADANRLLVQVWYT